MIKLDDRTTLAPGPGDDLGLEDRVKIIQAQVAQITELRVAINASFANLYDKLSELSSSLDRNMGLIREQVRHHSTRIHQLELAGLNGDKKHG